MPKNGFTSFSLKSDVYEYWNKKFLKNKEKLKMKGISSFSAYITFLINNSKVDFKTNFFYKKIELKNNLLVLRDLKNDRIIDLKIERGKIFCNIDQKFNCEHVGFAYSLPEVYTLLD